MQSRLMRLSGQSSRAGGGGGSSSSSNGSDSGQSSRAGGGGAAGSALRKGPWTAEEDEILVEYVRKNGPRDWSSIRSKGLLPRTGKSCRLRWVNKLKPDLKTGCKFTAEEERVVIELQAQLGNKWARIATYLPGRTDNDVKNFWSTRQKRLARILRTPLPPKSAAAATKSTTTSSTAAAATTSQGKQRLLQPPSPLPPALSLPLPLPQDQYASASHILLQDPCSDHLHLFDGVEDDSRYRCMIIDLPQMPEPLSCCPSMLEFDAPPPLLAVSAEPCSPFLTAPSQPALDHHHLLPQPLLGLPPDLALYQCQDPHFYDQLLPEELPFFGVKRSEQETALPVPDNFFFDDLPPDMFDFIDRPPPPPPPPPTTKSC